MQNTITLTGKMNFAPRVNAAKDGKQIANFQIGVYNGKDSSGKAKYFNIRVDVFDERIISNLMDTAVPVNVIVSGRLALDSYTDKNGNKVENFKITANSVGVDL